MKMLFSLFEIPPRAKSCIIFSLRTVWAVFLTLIIQRYWEWTSAIAYLSPILTVVASVRYFGLWQENILRVILGTLIGAAVGQAIGFLHQIPWLVILLLFISLVRFGTIRNWDRITKVMNSLALLIGAILVYTTDGEIYGLSAFQNTIAIVIMPFLLTGVGLLINPWPALAFLQVKPQIILTSQKLTRMSQVILQAFIDLDYVDVQLAEFHQLHEEIQLEIQQLKKLHQLIQNEQMFFYELRKVPTFITIYLQTIEVLLTELLGLRDIMGKITYNFTQQVFINEMKVTIFRLEKEIQEFFALVTDIFDGFYVFPESFRYSWFRFYQKWSQFTFSIWQRRRNDSSHPVLSRDLTLEPVAIETISSSLQKPRRVSFQTDRAHAYPQYQYTTNTIYSEEVPNTQPPEALARDEVLKGDPITFQTKKLILHRLQKPFYHLLHQLYHTRQELIEQFYQLRKEYIYFNPEIIFSSLLSKENKNEDGKSIDSKENRKDKTVKPMNFAHLPQEQQFSLREQILLEIALLYEVSEKKELSTSEGKKKEEEKEDVVGTAKGLSRTKPISEEKDDRPITTSWHTQPLKIQEEIIRLSLKNIGPRGAFFHRLSIFLESFGCFQKLIEEFAKEVEQSPANPALISLNWISNCYLLSLFRHYQYSISQTFLFHFKGLQSYLQESCENMLYFFRWGHETLSWFWRDPSSSPLSQEDTINHSNYSSLEEGRSASFEQSNSEKTPKIAVKQFPLLPPFQRAILRHHQSIKIALAIALSAIFPVYNPFPSLLQRGFWSTLIIALIRQDHLTSSFITAFQRMEGTVFGAVFSVIMYELFPCKDSASNDNNNDFFCLQTWELQFLILLIWLFICGLFREGELHGYAAVVAGFTPILLLNPTYVGLEAAFLRIEETFIAIVIYLSIDLLLYPRAIYPMMKQSILTSIEESRMMVNFTVQGVEMLLEFEEIGRGLFLGVTSEPSFVAETIETSESKDEESSTLSKHPTNSDQPVSAKEKCEDEDEMVVLEEKRSPKRKETIYDDFIEIRYQQTTQSLLPTHPHPNSSMTPIIALLSASSTSLSESNLHPRVKTLKSLYEQCSTFFDQADGQLHALQEEILKQADYLKMIPYEPNLFFYQFPTSTYQTLSIKFRNILQASMSLTHGCRALILLLVQMLYNQQQEGNIVQQLNHLFYMIKHLLIITNRSNLALHDAYQAFQRLYTQTDKVLKDSKLDSLLTLRRVGDQLLRDTEDNFRLFYLQQSNESMKSINPYFVIATQNVFESACDLVTALGELGMSLHIVRNIERIQYKKE